MIAARGLADLHEQTAGTTSPPPSKDAAHHFVADHSEPGYRPLCRICGRKREGHPYVNTPRRPR